MFKHFSKKNWVQPSQTT